MYYVELRVDHLNNCSAIAHKIDVKEDSDRYLMEDSENAENCNIYPPRGNEIFKDLSEEETEDLRSCGYAVEGKILYYSEDLYATYSKSPEKAVKLLQEEMIEVLNKRKQKIENKIQVVSDISLTIK